MESLEIEVERGEDYAILWWNRPQAGNKITVAMLDQAEQALAALEREAVKLIAIAGRGEHFCQGRDSRDPAEAALSRIAAFNRRLVATPLPVVALVRGQALAVGCGLVLHADLAYVHPQARLGFPELTHGLVPGLSLAYLDRLIPRAAASRLLYGAESLTGEEAYRLGLVTGVSEHPEAAFKELLGRLSKVPAQHLWWLKRFRQRSQALPEAEAYDRGIRLVAAVLRQDGAAVEALLA